MTMTWKVEWRDAQGTVVRRRTNSGCESVARRMYTEAVDSCKLLLAVTMVGMDVGKKERAVFDWLARAAPLRIAIGEDPFASPQLDQQTIEAQST
jgi:hypothetical protein